MAMNNANPGNVVRCQWSNGLSKAWRNNPPQLAVGA